MICKWSPSYIGLYIVSNNNAQKGETRIQLARYSPIMDICFKLDTNLSEGLFSNRAVYENACRAFSFSSSSLFCFDNSALCRNQDRLIYSCNYGTTSICGYTMKETLNLTMELSKKIRLIIKYFLMKQFVSDYNMWGSALLKKTTSEHCPKHNRKCYGCKGFNGIVLVLMETIMVSTGIWWVLLVGC